jgi:trk system potassium uptake protein TrkH
VAAILLGVLLVSASLHVGLHDNWLNALRIAAFQVISIGTSTGFASADSAAWPALSQLILMFFTLQCACAGSTSGGIKVDRIVLFGKALKKQISNLRHPRGVFVIKLDGITIEDHAAESAMIYILIYLAILLVSTMCITAFGVDLLTSFSSVAASMGNVGPGFGLVGSMNNYGLLPSPVKWILTADMLLGRLEIFALILFITIRQWK